MTGRESKKYYDSITLTENRSRLKLLTDFRSLVIIYFDNSRLNLMTGEYIEENDAAEAKVAINLILKEAYNMIRLANIKTYSASNTVLATSRHGKSMDIILNIFNLGRNEIPHETAVEYIDRAIKVYRSNRLDSFIRTMNPFFWISIFFDYIAGLFRKKEESAE